MKVWVVTYDDGDYYCEGEHIIGLYSTRELAEADKNYFEEHHYEHGYFGSWFTYVIEEFEIDKFQQWVK